MKVYAVKQWIHNSYLMYVPKLQQLVTVSSGDITREVSGTVSDLQVYHHEVI